MKTTRLIAAAALIGGTVLTLQLAHAQLAGLQRTDLLKQDVSVAGREVVQTRVDFPPGVASPRHSHPGEEVAYVLEGTLEYRIEGRAPVTVNAGEAVYIPSGAVHSATNVGSGKASEVATYFVDKARPLVVIAQ
jgi:quercetin dioxygenase-like cupin family protein